MSAGDPPRLGDYLDHALTAIAKVRRYVQGHDQPSFLGDELIQDAVIRNLEVLGEALQNIRSRFPEHAAAHPELPWGAAYGMRNALIHG